MTISGKTNLIVMSRSGANLVKIVPPPGGLAQNSDTIAGPLAANIFVSDCTAVTIANVTINDANSGISPGGFVQHCSR